MKLGRKPKARLDKQKNTGIILISVNKVNMNLALETNNQFEGAITFQYRSVKHHKRTETGIRNQNRVLINQKKTGIILILENIVSMNLALETNNQFKGAITLQYRSVKHHKRNRTGKNH